jgi:hypothetical protein
MSDERRETIDFELWQNGFLCGDAGVQVPAVGTGFEVVFSLPVDVFPLGNDRWRSHQLVFTTRKSGGILIPTFATLCIV